MMASECGRPIDEGALYTVEERLETFQVSYCHWPFDSGPCTPLKVCRSNARNLWSLTDYAILVALSSHVPQMAEAGFYFCGTESSPDWVRCITCHHNMEGWEAEDCPLYVLVVHTEVATLNSIPAVEDS